MPPTVRVFNIASLFLPRREREYEGMSESSRDRKMNVPGEKTVTKRERGREWGEGERVERREGVLRTKSGNCLRNSRI
jgi:hypothetical protein